MSKAYTVPGNRSHKQTIKPGETWLVCFEADGSTRLERVKVPAEECDTMSHVRAWLRRHFSLPPGAWLEMEPVR